MEHCGAASQEFAGYLLHFLLCKLHMAILRGCLISDNIVHSGDDLLWEL